MTPLMEAVSTALVHFLWQGMAVGVALWVALLCLRKAPAEARYLAGCCALLVMALLPLVTAAMVYRAPLQILTAPTGGWAAAPSATHAVAVSREWTAAAWVHSVEPWAVPVWSVGVLLFSLRLVWGCVEISTMKRRGKAVDAELLAVVERLGVRLGLRRALRVLKTIEANGPSVVGWLRPVLLLPSSTLLGLTPQQLEAVLAHELAHIRRHDHIVNAIQSLVETVLFYHPAVWWASASIRDERELCCDDLAVRACGDAICYARALTKLERLRLMTPSGALGSTGGELGYRIRRLMGMSNREYGPSKWHGLLALALGLAGVALNVNWARGQEVKSQSPENRMIAVAYTPDLVNDSTWITVDLRGASLVHRTNVEYPEVAMKAGVAGTVSVEVTLDGTGNVSDARVLSGPVELRKAVITSVLQWHFAASGAGATKSVNVTFQKPPAGSIQQRQMVNVLVPAGVGATAELASASSQSNDEKIENLKRAYNERRQQLAAERGWQQQVETLNASRDESAARQERANGATDEASARATNEIRSQLERLRQAYELMSSVYSPEHPEVLAVRREIRNLEARLRSPEDPNDAAARQKQLELESLQQQIRAARSRQQQRTNLIGAKVQTIEALDLSEPARTDLLSRLPVHIGDTLAESSVESLSKTIHDFDEHLRLTIEPREDSGGVVIRIVPMIEGVRK